MSNFEASLREKAKSPVATYHRFRTSVRDKSLLYLFVEGYEDVAFYAFACRLLGIRADFHVCFGKKNLDAVYTVFGASPIKDSSVGFIRDRDFDHFLGTVGDREMYFVTCGYAVENYVFTIESVSGFFLFNMGVNSREVDVSAYAVEFSERLSVLHTTLLSLYSCCFAAMREGTAFDLDKVDLSDHIRRVIDGSSDTYQLPAQISAISGLSIENVKDDDLKLAEKYCQVDAPTALRGKFLAEFARIFLNRKFDDLRVKHKATVIQSFNKACGSMLGKDALYSVLVGRAGVSERLKAFLNIAAPKL
jgi:hypothetical protein